MKSDKHAYQAKLWALIGPFLCLFSLFVISIKQQNVPFFLSFSLVVGLPVCWYFRLRGWVGCALMIFGWLLLEYQSLPIDERFWLTGITISNILALLVSSLSFEEMEFVIETIGVESRSRLENLWKVDEKKQALESELSRYKEEVRSLQIKTRSFQKLIDHSSDEIHDARARYDHLVQEMRDLKEENTRLAAELTKTADAPPAEAKYRQLREQFEEKSKVLDQTRRELFLSNEKLAFLQREFDEERWYALGEAEESLQQHLLVVSKENEEAERRREKEVEALHRLLDSLMSS